MLECRGGIYQRHAIKKGDESPALKLHFSVTAGNLWKWAIRRDFSHTKSLICVVKRLSVLLVTENFLAREAAVHKSILMAEWG